MMKIAFITNIFPQLSESFILNQVTGLIDRGHEVDVYAYSAGNDPKKHGDIEKYNLLRHTFYFGAEIHLNKYLHKFSRMWLLVINYCKQPASVLKFIYRAKFKKKALSLLISYRVRPFLGMDKYDIINCHFGPNGNLGVILKEVGAVKGKVITTFHGYDITKYINQNGNNSYDMLFEKGDLLLPISERWKDKLIELGCNKNKILVHRMGINTSKYPFNIRKRKNNKRICILTIARLVEKKGVQYGIQAVSKVLEKYYDLEYKIIGDGPLRNELESLIIKLNINNRVSLLGWMQQEEIVELMKDADILLAPSVTAQDGDQEGIPVVLMEALAQGLLVLSTWHSGIPELVQDGISGFLVPERDACTLAEKLMYLIEHQEMWQEMGRAGRAYVEKNYDINKLNDRLVDLYQQLLSKEIRHTTQKTLKISYE